MAIKSQLRLGQISGSLGHLGSTSAFQFSTGAGASEINYLNFDTQNQKLELGGSTVEIQLDGNIEGSAFLNENNMASNSATKLASQASIKAYVDSVAQGLAVKDSVRLATAAALSALSYNAGNGTLTANATGAESIDGQSVKQFDRILVKNQVDQKQNGIYEVTTVGTAQTGAQLLIRVMGNYSNINAGSTLSFDVDTDGAGGAQTFTITFVKPGSGTSDTQFDGGRNADIRIDEGATNQALAGTIRTLFTNAPFAATADWDAPSAVAADAGGFAFTIEATNKTNANFDFANVTADVNNQGEIFGEEADRTAAFAQVLTRAPDADGNALNGNAELGPGTFAFVSEGSANADKGFVMTGDQQMPAANNSVDIVFTQFSSVGAFSGGEGIDISNTNVISLDIDGMTHSMASADLVAGDFIAVHDTDASRSEKMTIESLLDKFSGTGLSRSGASLAVDASQAINALTGGDLTIFDDQNNADVSLSMGTGAAEALVIEVENGGANKTAEKVKFTSKTASGTADHGKFEFAVDEVAILEIVDDGLNLASAKSLSVAGSEILSAAQLSVPKAVLDGDHNYGGSDGSILHVDTGTLTDNTAGGGSTVARAAAVVFEGPSLAASNANVTTDDAATVYISDAPAAGANQTLTRRYALWADAGKVRIDGGIMAGTTDIINGSGEILVAAQPNITSVGALGTTQISSIELGHAHDTSIVRKGGGVIEVEGQEIGFATVKDSLEITNVNGIAANSNVGLSGLGTATDGVAFNTRFLAAGSKDREVYVNGQLLLEGAGKDYQEVGSDIQMTFRLEVGDVVQFIVRHKGS